MNAITTQDGYVKIRIHDFEELLAAFEAITERAEAVAEGIHVEKRSNGVSQATHVNHMANHLAQHVKIARAVIAKVKGE